MRSFAERKGLAGGGRRLIASSVSSLGLMLACAAAAIATRKAVSAEWLDDTASLMLAATTGLLIGGVALAAVRVTRRRSGWRSRVAAAIVPAGLMAICATFVVASLPDASVEMEAIVESRGPQSPPATIELGPKRDDVRLSGEIQEGVAKRLSALLAANPQVTRIHLTSEGGLADEGQAIGDVVAAHGLTTFVPDYCVSACTLIFVRGRERLMLDDARVGFHSPFEPGLFGAMYQGDTSEQRREYLAAGVEREFVDAALKVKPDDIWYPRPSRLIAAHVATAVVDHDRLPDSNLDGAATLAGARTFILRSFPVLDAFRSRSPDALDTVAAWYLDAYRSERSEGENEENLRSIVDSAALLALTRADDDTLVGAGRFLARGMAAASDPEACLRIGAEVDLVEAEAQLDRAAADDSADAQARAIVAAATAGHRTKRGKGNGGPLAALADADGDKAGCAAARSAYEALLKRPQAEAAASLRRLADVRAADALATLRTVVSLRP